MTEIDKNKVLWIGGYPSHYVRAMHLKIETIRPGAVHFIYIKNNNNSNERDFEYGQLPLAITLLEGNFPIMSFLNILKRSRPRALIISGYDRPLFVSALLWSYWNRIKFCFWCDTNIIIIMSNSFIKRLLKKTILGLLFSRAYKLLYIGSRNRDFYIWLLGLRKSIDKLFFLPYPAIIDDSSKSMPDDFEGFDHRCREKFKLIYLGRLVPVKAVHKVLEALLLLPLTIRNNILLDIFGGGSEESRLEKLSEKYGLSDLVTFHGPIPSNQVEQVYLRADLFLLPSDNEPWGLVVNEALAARLPVLCSFWVGASADLISDGETGYLLRNNSPASIAEGIERAYHMGSLNKRLGERGFERISEGGWHVKNASNQLALLLDILEQDSVCSFQH